MTGGKQILPQYSKKEGSFHFKSPRGGRGHGPDFVHIQYLITIRYTKTKSEVFGQVMT